MEAAAMDPGARFTVDDFLNFNLPDVDDREDDDDKALKTLSSMDLSDPNSRDPGQNGLFPDGGAEEEELEWLNEGTFPPVETYFGILSENPGIVLNHQSPVSVLESSSNATSNGSTITSCCGGIRGGVAVPVRYPVKARSKRRRRKRHDLPTQQCWSWSQQNFKSSGRELTLVAAPAGGKIGRRCLHCQTEKTPQWRAGPMGPKTLCNACGVRYKSGRLVPEYRPASSPTFSSVLHSNSHRKIVEMRKKKQVGGGGGGMMMVLNKDCEYRVG